MWLQFESCRCECRTAHVSCALALLRYSLFTPSHRKTASLVAYIRIFVQGTWSWRRFDFSSKWKLMLCCLDLFWPLGGSKYPWRHMRFAHVHHQMCASVCCRILTDTWPHLTAWKTSLWMISHFCLAWVCDCCLQESCFFFYLLVFMSL